MYSLGNILTKEPVVIAGAIRSVLWVLVLLGAVQLVDEQLAGIALALEVVLGLLARQATTPTTSPTLDAGTTVTVKSESGGTDKVTV